MRHSVSWRQDAKILRGRLGAGDEGARGDFTGDGEDDHVVASGGDRWGVAAQHEALAAALRGARIRWTDGPAAGEAESEACSPGTGGRSVAALSREVCGPECTALSREAEGGA